MVRVLSSRGGLCRLYPQHKQVQGSLPSQALQGGGEGDRWGAKREQGQSWTRLRRPLGRCEPPNPSLPRRLQRGTLPLDGRHVQPVFSVRDKVFTAGTLTRPAGLLPSSSGSAGGCPSPATLTPGADQIRELRAAAADFSKRAVMLSVN